MADSALRSSKRMRRLVGDLLLLARADAGREAPRAPGRPRRGRARGGRGGRRALVRPPDVARPARAGDDRRGRGRPPPPGGQPRRERADPHGRRARRSRSRCAARATPRCSRWPTAGRACPADLRERVFERFARGSADTARAGGSGLGLAIVKAVADAHGGRVELLDAPGGGARFVVSLPVGRARVGALRSRGYRVPGLSNTRLSEELPREVHPAPAAVAGPRDLVHRPVRVAGRRVLRRRDRLHRQPRDPEQHDHAAATCATTRCARSTSATTRCAASTSATRRSRAATSPSTRSPARTSSESTLGKVPQRRGRQRRGGDRAQDDRADHDRRGRRAGDAGDPRAAHAERRLRRLGREHGGAGCASRPRRRARRAATSRPSIPGDGAVTRGRAARPAGRPARRREPVACSRGRPAGRPSRASSAWSPTARAPAPASSPGTSVIEG